MKRTKRYTVSDGKLVLYFQEADEGGFIITSPLDPELITEAETIEEGFRNARDAARALRQSRGKIRRAITAAPSED
jgi:antitoxin HicB